MQPITEKSTDAADSPIPKVEQGLSIPAMLWWGENAEKTDYDFGQFLGGGSAESRVAVEREPVQPYIYVSHACLSGD